MTQMNEDFADRARQLQQDLAKQIGKEVIGCSMFFLTKDVDGVCQWCRVSNYNGEVTAVNMLYLYESVVKEVDEILSSREKE